MSMYPKMGIPLKDVGVKLEKVSEALKEQGCYIGNDYKCSLFFDPKSKDKVVQSATTEVFFFQDKEPEKRDVLKDLLDKESSSGNN